MIVLSIGAVSAQDADDAVASTSDDVVLEEVGSVTSGTASGGVDVVTENPWNTSGELSYDIPSDAKTIKSADVYVNVYSGSAKNTHGADANITITTANGENKYSASLWIEEGSTDGTVYPVNNHTTKCYSDYMIHYNVTNLLKGLNGTNLKIKADTFKMDNKSFDGRIKLLGLVLAYDDGDDDIINYWINDNQIWTNSNTTLTFDTSSLTDVLELSLTNVALSSSDATYKMNGEFLADADYKSGNYYQYNKWDATDYFKRGNKTEFTAFGTAGSYGISYKNVLSVLTAKPGVMQATVSLATERVNKGVTIAYPGTYNQITVTVNTNKNGKYTIQLLADGEIVNSTDIPLTDGSKKVTIIDPTFREIDQSTAYVVGKYNNVTYTAKLLLKDQLVNESSIKAAILYNGYFEKDYSYPGVDFVSFLNETVSGDFAYLVSDGAYASTMANRVESWNVALPDNSSFVKTFVYAAYSSGTDDTIDLFNVTFNGVKPEAVFFSRDQPNVIATAGYGLIVYDVTDLIKAGENTFALNKTNSAGAYPSTLIYLYNTTGSTVVKNVYISNGAELLGTYGNTAGRTLKADSTLYVADSDVIDAKIYVFGAGATEGRATISVNGEVDSNVWNTSLSNQINIYEKDITPTLKTSNDVSIILNNNMFIALQQIIVATKKVSTKFTGPFSVAKIYNVAKSFTVTLKDANGKALSKTNVTLVINGKKTTPTTDAKGQLKVTIANLAPKTYTAKITYAGDATHKTSSKSVKVVVKKATPKLTAGKKTFKVKTKIKKYTVTLKTNKGKAMKNVKLTLKVKGKTYTAKTNSKGKATFKITKLTKKGTHKATITYKGNSYYNKVVKKNVKITVKK